jgi:hypothetical protein
MHAAVGHVTIDPSRMDEAEKQLNEMVVPTVKEANGFVSGIWTHQSPWQGRGDYHVRERAGRTGVCHQYAVDGDAGRQPRHGRQHGGVRHRGDSLIGPESRFEADGLAKAAVRRGSFDLVAPRFVAVGQSERFVEPEYLEDRLQVFRDRVRCGECRAA